MLPIKVPSLSVGSYCPDMSVALWATMIPAPRVLALLDSLSTFSFVRLLYISYILQTAASYYKLSGRGFDGLPFPLSLFLYKQKLLSSAISIEVVIETR